MCSFCSFFLSFVLFCSFVFQYVELYENRLVKVFFSFHSTSKSVLFFARPVKLFFSISATCKIVLFVSKCTHSVKIILPCVIFTAFLCSKTTFFSRGICTDFIVRTNK